MYVGGNSTGIDTFRGSIGTDTVKLFDNLVRSELVLDSLSGVEVLDLAGFSLDGNAGSNLFDLSGIGSVLNVSGIIEMGSGNDVFRGHAGKDVVDGGNSNDELFGNAGDDELHGGSGNDLLDGGDGDDIFWIRDVDTDTFVGGAGTDSVKLLEDTERQVLTLDAASGVEVLDTAGHRLTGTLAADVFDLSGLTQLAAGKSGILLLDGDDSYLGRSGADIVNGGSGSDTVSGNGGRDRLDGGVGADTLTGGDGADSFVFSTRAVRNAQDAITDFDTTEDRILFDNRIFDTLGPDGRLSKNAFVANTSGKAEDRSDRLVYETDTGNLFYDANGSGKGKAVLVAQLDAGLDLGAGDFLVI
ncbi:MAG: calcium-binding protein, partial [Rhizobiaceae bacterium]